MSVIHGSKTQVRVNGRDLTGYLKTFDLADTIDKADTTVFSNTAKTCIPGLRDGTIKAGGFWDGALNAVDDVMLAALGASTDSIWTLWPSGEHAVGDVGYAAACVETTYGVRAVETDVIAVSADANANHGIDEVKSHHPLASEATGTIDSASVDGSAASTAGGVSYLHVTALTATNIVVTVEDSADNASWATLITHSTVVAAGASARIALATTATVRRYTRSQAVITGAGAATYSHAFSRK